MACTRRCVIFCGPGGWGKGRDDAGDIAQQRYPFHGRGAVVGSHLCLFYETQDDLIDTASCYFAPVPRER